MTNCCTVSFHFLDVWNKPENSYNRENKLDEMFEIRVFPKPCNIWFCITKTQ